MHKQTNYLKYAHLLLEFQPIVKHIEIFTVVNRIQFDKCFPMLTGKRLFIDYQSTMLIYIEGFQASPLIKISRSVIKSLSDITAVFKYS